MLERRPWKYCNSLVYPILARMLSFFEKLKPDIKDVIVSHCIFDGKIQISKLQKGAKRPHRNFDFMNKIEVRSNTVFYQLGRLNYTRAQTF